jgi:hypothetical protein
VSYPKCIATTHGPRGGKRCNLAGAYPDGMCFHHSESEEAVALRIARKVNLRIRRQDRDYPEWVYEDSAPRNESPLEDWSYFPSGAVRLGHPETWTALDRLMLMQVAAALETS